MKCEKPPDPSGGFSRSGVSPAAHRKTRGLWTAGSQVAAALPSKTGTDRAGCSAQCPLQWTKFAVRMKAPAPLRCTAALLGLWFLVACALPPLWRMTCSKSGRAVVEWFNPTPCMEAPSTDPEAAQLEATCCSYTHASIELSPTLHKASPSALILPAVLQSVPLVSAGLASMAMGVQRPTAHAPPLWRVLQRLALSGKFLL